MTVTRTPPSGDRPRNKRGEGSKLRGDILDAATRLLVAGGPEAITLRAVARDVGIATTSIYSHFADREEILDAIADRGFTEMADITDRAMTEESDPVGSLLAGCRAYLGYATNSPQLYTLLFTTTLGPSPKPGLRTPKPFQWESQSGARLFHNLVSGIQGCIDAGLSDSADAFADALAVWSALHGYAGLRANLLSVPWPEDERTLTHLVGDLAHLRRLSATDQERPRPAGSA
ncbi:TetR/AcrR family transcriptional regulator [Actinacidiphila guanduensis]|uniref:Transcriptional regulator, TetR family n=1 Tax=Actinacidiphila guanduensis TaxID=310781 RepID=A0A1H0SL44_9ACTN|nr:TetR/AcrR family transcriptional regulator [Actinacidiphila guanduensis]SDP41866.1 transcriptional regulator, TetR family [Actinacidiphila guanduensis]